jgi:hypothetical protein
MAGSKEILLCLLLMPLMATVVGCGNENLAVENLEEPLTVSSSTAKLPSWLLLEHRRETLSDEDLGFVVIESEYRVALEEEEKAASSPTVKASSAGNLSGNPDDKWKGLVATPQQSSSSGSWWEQPSSTSNNTGQIVHNVRYDLDD